MSEAADRIRAYLDGQLEQGFPEPRTIVHSSDDVQIRTDDLREVLSAIRNYEGLEMAVARALGNADGKVELGDYHDENTLPKVRRVLAGFHPSTGWVDDIITELMNAGILFRERRPVEVKNSHSPLDWELTDPMVLVHEAKQQFDKVMEPPMRYWAYTRWSGKKALIKAERLTFEASGHVVGWIGDLPVLAEKREDVNSLRLLSAEEVREEGLT